MGKRSRNLRKAKQKISNSVGIEIGANTLKPNSNMTDEEIIKKMYRIEPSPCSNQSHQKGNCSTPQCLKGFIQQKDPFNLNNELKKLGRNPADLFRPENKFIGLENLGATCYMNSLLQCLFMNRNFRNCVYMWKRDDNDDSDNNNNINNNKSSGNNNNIITDEEYNNNNDQNENGNGKNNKKKESIEDSICFQLQLLFATLQFSMLSSYSPQTLISLLNIKTSIQQDAQEFNKLFITYLEERFHSSNNEIVKSFIKNEFQGKYSYNTTCKVCNQISKKEEVFYELELNIQNAKNLESCIRNYIKEEELVGDNQYDCPNCKLVDATRKMNLLSLPPTLNFQLIRYQFDLKSGKKKLQNRIEFPATLNMTSFLSDYLKEKNGEEKDEKEEKIYELSAVLMHLGQSAYGGHYIAQIKDELTGKWWKFNDSNVTEIKFNEVGESDSLYDSFSHQTPKKGQNSVNQISNDCLASSNAYMLIYTRKNREILNDVEIPNAVNDHVFSQNSSLMLLSENYETEKQKITEEITLEKEFYQKVMSTINVNHNSKENKEFQWIDSIWLSKFIRGEKNIGKITNENLVCPHDRVDPKQIERMKQISDVSAKLLFERYGGEPVLTHDHSCFICAISYYDELLDKQEQRELQLKMGRLAFGKRSNNNNEKSFIVPTDWMNSWRNLVNGNILSRPLNENITADITCNHKQLSCTDNKRYVSEEVWNYLKSVYPKTEIAFSSNTKPCNICTKEAEEYKKLLVVRTQDRLLERRKLNSLHDSPVNKKSLPAAGTYFLIPYLWHSEWKSFITDPHISDRPEKIDNSPFLCEHEKLIFNPIVFSNSNNQNSFVVIRENDWNFLLTLYEGGPPISFTISGNKNVRITPEICEGCKAIKDQADFALRLNYKSKNIWVTTNGFGSNRSIPKKLNVNVNSEDTIVILKMKLMEQTHLTPVEQQISYNDQILDDPNKTLEEYGILPGYILELKKIECDDHSQSKETGKSRSEEAFEQSIFSSKIDYDNEEDEEENSKSEISINEIPNEKDLKKWSCQGCTFLNDENMENCELCHKIKPSPISEPTTPGWSCNTCTYHNPLNRNVCEICKTRR